MNWIKLDYLCAFVIGIFIAKSRIIAEPGHLKEYCQHDTFNATCPHGHVIMMTEARFGRMRLGRCLRKTYNVVGCGEDVLQYMDTPCGDRSSCQVQVTDIPKQGVRPCSDELSYYLEAKYECIRAEIQPSCGMTHVLRPGAFSGFLSSSIRSSVCPWKLRALPGQRFNITLFDFGTKSEIIHGPHPVKSGTGIVSTIHKLDHTSPICKRYATIEEPMHHREIPICSGKERVRHVLISEGHQINLNLVPGGQSDMHFFIHYEAIGCPRVNAPSNSHVTYTYNTMTVTCNITGDTWYLTCRNNKWVGTIANCTLDPDTSVLTVLMVNWKSPYGILVIAGLGISFGVILGVLLLIITVFLVKRYRIMCPCLPATPPVQCHSTCHGQAGNKKNTMTAYGSGPQGVGVKTDVMLCDYAGKTWLSQRPLPDPNASLDQQAELLAYCREEEACDTVDMVYPGLPPSAYHTAPMRPHVGAYGLNTSSLQRPCYAGHVYESPNADRSDVI